MSSEKKGLQTPEGLPFAKWQHRCFTSTKYTNALGKMRAMNTGFADEVRDRRFLNLYGGHYDEAPVREAPLPVGRAYF